jgi:hypothetical protein
MNSICNVCNKEFNENDNYSHSNKHRCKGCNASIKKEMNSKYRLENKQLLAEKAKDKAIKNAIDKAGLTEQDVKRINDKFELWKVGIYQYRLDNKLEHYDYCKTLSVGRKQWIMNSYAVDYTTYNT